MILPGFRFRHPWIVGFFHLFLPNLEMDFAQANTNLSAFQLNFLSLNIYAKIKDCINFFTDVWQKKKYYIHDLKCPFNSTCRCCNTFNKEHWSAITTGWKLVFPQQPLKKRILMEAKSHTLVHILPRQAEG